MSSDFPYFPVFEYHDSIGRPDRLESVGNDDGRSALHEGFQCRLNDRFGLSIDARSRLVEYEYLRVGDQDSGKRQQLPLSLR